MSLEDMPVDKLVSVYIKIRDAREEKEALHKAEMEKLDEQFDVITTHLLELCTEQNLDGFKTPVGTVSRRITTRYWTSDWESMYKFIQEHDAPFLLEKRIHVSSMKEFLQENPDVFPMGMQADKKYTISVRKPTKS